MKALGYRFANIEIDIRRMRSRDLRGFDAVIHLAALSTDPLGDLNPVLSDMINHQVHRLRSDGSA